MLSNCIIEVNSSSGKRNDKERISPTEKIKKVRLVAKVLQFFHLYIGSTLLFAE